MGATTERRTVAAATPGQEQANATILVCDDQEDIVGLLVSVLEMEGYTPVPAYCGTAALEIVRRQSVDLVLLDKAMPDLDGFEVCRQIKAMVEGRFLPVILVTAKAHQQDKLAGLNLGADDYITKPFDVEEVLAKVRVMLRIKRIEDQLVQRNVALASFNAVAGVVGESLILEEMLHNSLAEILRLMDLPCGAIFLRHEETDEFSAAASVFRDPDGPDRADTTFDTSRLAVAPDASTCHDLDLVYPQLRARHHLASCVGIPLTAKGRVLGVMTLAGRRRDMFAPHGPDLEVLESLGSELGIAIEHALLYRDAQRTVEQLREIDALKSQVISTASHEFRTPLSIVKGFANLLKRKEDFGFDRETERHYLGLIDGQVNVLTGLVEDMLSAARIEAGRMQVRAERLDLGALIVRIATPIGLQAGDRAITLTVDRGDGSELHVYADARHIEGVVSNLLSNAVKYSDNGTRITVRLFQEGSGENAEARVDVIDQGVGIAPEQMPHLFERFTRLENRRSIEAGGTGLGLYLVHNWIEANRGRIWAESAVDRGSTFSFALPLYDAAGSRHLASR